MASIDFDAKCAQGLRQRLDEFPVILDHQDAHTGIAAIVGREKRADMLDFKKGKRVRTRRQMIGAIGAAAGAATLARRLQAATRRLRVLSTTDRPIVQPLIEAFERRHPDYGVDYIQAGSAEVFEGFVASSGRLADVVWSSAMDLQIKLVNDGYALTYRCPHATALPSWAVWRHEAYATTWEPVGFAFHRTRLAQEEVPTTHAALVEKLYASPGRFTGQLVTYDIERSGIGYLLTAQDVETAPGAWSIPHALGLCRAGLYTDTHAMLEALSCGEALIAYNTLGSYAEAFAREHPEIGIVYPTDYTLIMSRVALISRMPQEPVGARLWIDFLLSPDGQQLLGRAGALRSIRLDAPEANSSAMLEQQLRGAARPIALGLGLLANLDRSKRDLITRRWRREYEAGQSASVDPDVTLPGTGHRP